MCMQGVSSSSLRAPILAARRLEQIRRPPSSYLPDHTPGAKQHQFITSLKRQVFFGGGKGCGKSDAALFAAVRWVHVPYYSCLILRRTFADLSKPGAIMDRSLKWWKHTDAKWQGDKKTWTFPSGARIVFGHMETDADRFNYDGGEYQQWIFDELPHFTKLQYTHGLTCVRGPAGGIVPLQLRGTGTPGASGQQWVTDWFVDSTDPDREYIYSTYKDNPGIDQVDFAKMMAALPEIQRAQYEVGDWKIRVTGGKFKREWFNFCSPSEVPRHGARTVRFWDLASTAPVEGQPDPDYAAGVRVTEKGGEYWIEDVARIQGNPADVEKLVQDRGERDGRSVSVYIEQEKAATGKALISHYARNVLKGFAVYGAQISGDKEIRADIIASAAELGHVHLVRAPWNDSYLDELVSFPTGRHDDQVDATSGAIHVITPMVNGTAGRTTNIGSAARDLGDYL